MMSMSTQKTCTVSPIPKKAYTIFFDVSGSIGGNRAYMEAFLRSYEKIRFSEIKKIYGWGNGYIPYEKLQFEQMINNLCAASGWRDLFIKDVPKSDSRFVLMNDTKPIDIARILMASGFGSRKSEASSAAAFDEPIDEIIFISTDGGVLQSGVQELDGLLGESMFEEVCVVIGNSGKIDESVAAPFTRRADKGFVSTYNGIEQKIVYIDPEARAVLANLNSITLENFEEYFPKLQEALITRFMGSKGDEKLTSGLEAVKKRIGAELCNRTKDVTLDERVMQALKRKNFREAFKCVKCFNDGYLSDPIMEFTRNIDRLISISRGLEGEFNRANIVSKRVATAPAMAEERVPQRLTEAEEPIEKIECPISLDFSVGQIICKGGKPILQDEDKAIVDAIINMPLTLLNYPAIVAKLTARIGQVIGIDCGIGIGDKNPFTREEIAFTIPLGKSKQCGRVAVSAMSELFFGDNKLPGNRDMYFAVIWCLIKTGKIPWLADAEKQVAEVLTWRLETSKTRASLCGLEQMVSTIVPTCVAVWYSVVSCLLDQPTDRDTLRFQIPNIDALLMLIDMLDYPMDPSVFTQVNRTRAMMFMLNMSKRQATAENPISGEDELRSLIKALVRSCYKVNIAKLGKDVVKRETIVPFIPLEDVASREQIAEIISRFPSYFSQLTIAEIVQIGGMVNRQLSASDIRLPSDMVINTLQTPKRCWGYELSSPRISVPINPNTFRPEYFVDGIKPWQEVYVPIMKLPARALIFSGTSRIYLGFYLKYERWPNQDEYVVFAYNRYCIGQKIGSLPEPTVQWFSEDEESYDPIRQIISAKNITSANVCKLITESCPLSERLKAKQ